MTPQPPDEMVDGQGGLRAHWRDVLGAVSALGDGGLAERGRRLDLACESCGRFVIGRRRSSVPQVPKR